MKWVVMSDDGRYVKKVDMWDYSSTIVFELCNDVESALAYPIGWRAEGDAALFNNPRGKYGRMRRFIIEKYGELTFRAEGIEC